MPGADRLGSVEMKANKVTPSSNREVDVSKRTGVDGTGSTRVGAMDESVLWASSMQSDRVQGGGVRASGMWAVSREVAVGAGTRKGAEVSIEGSRGFGVGGATYEGAGAAGSGVDSSRAGGSGAGGSENGGTGPGNAGASVARGTGAVTLEWSRRKWHSMRRQYCC
ncbi:alanine and glycine-rich protein-like [Schistocerca nitens]|uniref:alanine and glycine-rich protein-like n=1 Tax=Schistocerca nitens TaxID=7011 RepID=UPI002118FB34|nr:alanine and glycine-rich protein-like [Schistocerca nitens]